MMVLELAKRIGVMAGLILGLAGAASATLVASYGFNNTLNSSVGGAPALVATDPLGLNGFQSATVFGNTQTVYHVDGNASPNSEQAGLTLDTTGLLSANNLYSLEMVVRVVDNSSWRRLVDVSGLTSDGGLYVNPNDNVTIAGLSFGPDAIDPSEFVHIVVVNNNSQDALYVNGVHQFTFNSTIMDISDPGDLMHLFLDNLTGANAEYGDADIARFRLYDTAFDAVDVTRLFDGDDGAMVPEPVTLGLVGLGLAGVGALRRKKRAER